MIFKYKNHFSSFLLLLSVFVIQLLLFITSSSAQSITWQRAYDGPLHGKDGAYTICPADGNNMYIGGFIGTIPTYGYVIKIDSLGDTLWQKNISQVPMILTSVPLPEGSCVFAGYAGTIYAAKILPTGQIAWLNHYGGHSSSKIIRTIDNGFIGCGDGGNLDAYIYKLDSTGVLIWEKYYGSAFNTFFNAIALSTTNGYVVCGSISESQNDSGKGYVAGLDNTGSIVWEKKYYGKSRSFEKISAINNGYLIAGNKLDTAGSGFIRAFIMKTDLFGNLTLFKEFYFSATEYTSDLLFINNNRYVLVLQRYSGSGYNTRIMVLDSLANITKQKIISDSRGATELSSIITAPNSSSGDYVLAGYTTITSSNDDIYAIRIDSSMTNLSPFGIQGANNTVPLACSLSQNYPNPFNPSTRITFQVFKGSGVRIALYDVTGKLLRNFLNKEQSAGTYILDIDCSEYSGGIYFCSLYADGALINSIKMVLLK